MITIPTLLLFHRLKHYLQNQPKLHTWKTLILSLSREVHPTYKRSLLRLVFLNIMRDMSKVSVP